MLFKNWLESIELENQIVDEGWKDWVAGAAAVIGGMAAGTPEVSSADFNNPAAVKKIEGTKWTKEDKLLLIDYVKQKYGVSDLKLSEFETYRPIDIAKEFYGDHLDDVVEKARKAQSEKPNDASITLVSKLYDEIPVIFRSPEEFKFAKSTTGFCLTISRTDGKRLSVCIIDPKLKKENLPHELAHASQLNTKKSQGSFSNNKHDSATMEYLDDLGEIGARISHLKKTYVKKYMKTDKANPNQDPNNAKAGLAHFVQNRDLYPEDVQQLFFMFVKYKQLGKLEAFTKFMAENWVNYVKGKRNKNIESLAVMLGLAEKLGSNA